jgi:hypothetical protein
MDYRELATKEAKRVGIDPNLYLALIQQESGFNPSARSPVGAYGLTQVMPATAKDPGFGIRPLTDIHDPNEQVRFGADYLAKMLDRYDGNEAKALAAYNWGAGNADKWGGTDMSALPEETRTYIRNITGNAGLADGPTLARASRGLPLAGAHPTAEAEAEPEKEYADNFLGRMQQKRDTMRAGLGDKLGFDEDQMAGVGRGLGALGQQLMSGGF